MARMFLGLRTIIYPSPDLDAGKAWFTRLLGFEPYFDEPFFVGYSVGGYELALDPNGSVDDGPVTYWGVPDCDEAWQRLLGEGASPREAVRDVGESIRVATVVEPSGNIIGVIENPHFQLPDDQVSPGPGR
jgi:predicted enzyme related to lactoylglutathione lyase